MKGIRHILIYWAIILIIYGVLLAFIRHYETLSAFYHLALLVFPLALVFSKKETWERLGLKKGNSTEGTAYLFVIAIVLVGITYLRGLLSYKHVNIVFDFSFPFFATVVLGPISEELFHRGLLQTKLQETWNKTWAIVFPAILFALIHVPKLLFAKDYVSASAPTVPFLSSPIISLIYFFVLGVMFGCIYRETKSIYYAIGTHALVNLILVIFV